MDEKLAIRLLDEMEKFKPVAVVPFFRGESLLHPHWFTILKHARKLDMGEIQFTTNASLLTPENVERVLDLDLGFISFSLDTVDPNLYNANRRGADFETTTRNVLHFLKRKDERKVATQVQVSAVETTAHKPGMDDFVDFWLPKVDRVRVYVEHSSDGNPGSIEELSTGLESRRPCHKPSTDMVIYWNGQVAACNHDWTRMVDGVPLGDVTRGTIEKVWNAEPYQKLRQEHMDGQLDGVKPCADCDHWKMPYSCKGYLGRIYTTSQT